MKKIILTLLLTICFISGVKAEEIDSCYNNHLIDITYEGYYQKYNVSSDTWEITSWSNSGLVHTIHYLFPVKPSTTYYIRFFTGNTFSSNKTFISTMYYYDSDKNYVSGSSSTYATTEGNQYVFETLSKETIAYLSLTVTNDTKSNFGTTIAFADFDLSTCPIVEEPELPEPEVPEIIPDTTLTDFYTIYLDKLKNLSNYAMENKFILSAICMILLFVVLEIILNLFNGGGIRK